MHVGTTNSDPLKHPCQALLIGCFENDVAAPLFGAVDEVLGGCLTSLYERKEFTGKLNKVMMIHSLGRLPAERIVLVGLGARGKVTSDRMRQASGTAIQHLRSSGVKGFTSFVHMADNGSPDAVRATVEGFVLGGYSFLKYKSSPEEMETVDNVTLLFPEASSAKKMRKTAQDAQTVCEAVLFARDLVSQPGNVATPSYLAEKALEMAGKQGIRCRVLEREEMERSGMEALLAVARGSRQPPKFIILEYMAAGEEKGTTVLVGKGVTFDSGGISLKPREGMEKMKDDMAGAAAVMGTLMAAAALKLSINLVGLVPAVENLPGGNAYKPGDLVRSMAGKTIEVVNTDAEGRLILCDALHFAQSFRPAGLIDIATLTGACVIALGEHATGLMGNDEELKRAIKKAGEATGERVWELPLWDDYAESMKSDIADLKNAGGPAAGTITAGWFLQQFVGSTPWVHLDIAGTAWEDKGKHFLPKGATGVGVRLLVDYLRRLG